MEQILLVIHLLIAIVLIGVVLMQRSEGGGLGIGGGGGGGGGGGMSGFMTGRGTANLLTRTTAILAACFMMTSIGLAILAGGHSDGGSILDQPVGETFVPPTPVLPDAAPGETDSPSEPSVPLQ
ncbi:preprotein translocase subunit SecG [Algihabitans sp.]|uniref:preprotein translocase subunit SecG n=1 Tax=Algihabitans sp. TaxID=2821514 RepID=UPI003BAC9866